jgi:hypothetical protein
MTRACRGDTRLERLSFAPPTGARLENGVASSRSVAWRAQSPRSDANQVATRGVGDGVQADAAES